jgi:NADH:ubiquinone oxidoreductase subunit K
LVPLEHFLFLGAALFVIGIMVIITRKNAIVVLMGIELILNAANINLVAFSQYDPNMLQGQVFSLFVIVLAAAESAVGLAIVLRIYQYFKTSDVHEVSQLRD